MRGADATVPGDAIVIMRAEAGVLYDKCGRELCPACLELDPCRCPATPTLRAQCYDQRARLMVGLAELRQLVEIQKAAPARQWANQCATIIVAICAITAAMLVSVAIIAVFRWAFSG